MDNGHIATWTERQTGNITLPSAGGNKTGWYNLTSRENYVAFPCCQTIEISMLLFLRPLTFDKPNNVLLFTFFISYLLSLCPKKGPITPHTTYR